MYDVFLIPFTYTDWNLLSIFGKYYPVHGIWPSSKFVKACTTIKKLFFSKKACFLFFLRKQNINTFGASRGQFVHKIIYFHKNSDSQSFDRSYSHEIYNINDWSFFLARKFTNFSKKNLLIYIKPSKSNYQLKMQEKCKKSWKFNFWPLISPNLWV